MKRENGIGMIGIGGTSVFLYLIMPLLAVLVGLLIVFIMGAAAKPAPSPTVQTVPAYGGKFPYQLDQDGLQMVMVELPIPFPGEYTVVFTQQGSESAAAEDFGGLFSIESMFVDTFQPGYFIAGLRGEPGASGWVQYVAAPVVGVK